MMEVHAVSQERASVSACGQTFFHDKSGPTCLYIDGCGLWEHEIRQRAYDISLARRGAPRDPQSDWLQAKTELLGRRALGLT